jgi:hypothetical protein
MYYKIFLNCPADVDAKFPKYCIWFMQNLGLFILFVEVIRVDVVYW